MISDIYSPPKADLSGDNNDPVFAGFWIRTAASLIDTIWLLLLVGTLGWVIYGAVYFSSTEFIMGYGDFLISYVLPFVITMLFWVYKSATPGKMILGLKIVDSETLGPVSNGRLVLRHPSEGHHPFHLETTM